MRQRSAKWILFLAPCLALGLLPAGVHAGFQVNFYVNGNPATPSSTMSTSGTSVLITSGGDIFDIVSYSFTEFFIGGVQTFNYNLTVRQNQGMIGDTLRIQATDQNFSLPGGPTATVDLNSTININTNGQLSTSHTYQSFGDPGNVMFATTASTPPQVNSTGTVTQPAAFTRNGNYSLSNDLTIAFNGVGDNNNNNSQLSLQTFVTLPTAPAGVPEPATLGLSLSGLGLLWIYRRLRCRVE